MNHLTAWAITITAFGSGLYSIYKYILAKYYFNYDVNPIHYRLNKQTKIKKRYKTFKKRNRKYMSLNNINRSSVSRTKNDYKLNRWNVSK